MSLTKVKYFHSTAAANDEAPRSSPSIDELTSAAVSWENFSANVQALLVVNRVCHTSIHNHAVAQCLFFLFAK